MDTEERKRDIESREIDREFLKDNPNPKICEFFTDIKGKTMKCTCENPKYMIRCSCVCATHYYSLLRDNKKRNKQGIKIPNSFETLRSPFKSEITTCNKEIEKPKDKPEFIVEDCEVPEIIIEL